MRDITEDFVQQFRYRRKNWDMWQLREWMMKEEARLKTENPGLYDYIVAVSSGLGERLDASVRSFICDRLYFHLLELLAIVREHEQIEELEKLWRRNG